MQKSDPLEILLAHDRWATAQVFDACEKLTPEQFHRPFEMGPGSLHNTCAHILGAMQTWIDTLQGKPPGARIDQDGKQHTIAELKSVLDAAARELAAEAGRLPLDQTVTRTRDGKTFTFTRAVVLTHVTTHGMHHRAQCLNMLRHLGVKPLPPSSVNEWSRMAQ